MDLIVTEVTEMAGGRCVAGWDQTGQRMLRPLLDGHNWTVAEVDHLGLAPGSVLKVEANGKHHAGSFPHSTEDMEVVRASVKAYPPAPFAWFGNNAPPTSGSLQDAFDGNLAHHSTWNGWKQGVHVPVDAHCSSLVGLAINANSLELFTDDYGKLRVHVADDDDRYALKVSSHAILSAFAAGGLAAAIAVMPTNGIVHARIGLARPYNDYPTKCFAMLNGINW